MDLESLTSLNLVSLDSLGTSNNVQNISCNDIISDLPALSSTSIDPSIVDLESISSTSSVTNISNLPYTNLLMIVIAMLSIIGLAVFIYKVNLLLLKIELLVMIDTLLMDNNPANDQHFTRFIERLRMKVDEWDRNTVVDLRFFKPGLGVEYRSLTTRGSLVTNRTRSNHYFIIDNNDNYGIAILAMKDFNNRGLAVVKHNGEWLVGCLYEGTDSFIQRDLITGDRFRAFPVSPIWYYFHSTFGNHLTSNGRPVSFNAGQKTGTIYEIQRLGLQRRFHE